MIPHNRPFITSEDRAAVDLVLNSGWLAQGRCVVELEAEFRRRLGGGGACAVSSGTAALFLALRALGMQAGARVAVPTYACSALLNAVHMAGASPCVVDVDPNTFCIDPLALSRQSNHIDCVIAVHTFGAPADVSSLRKSADNIVEDCCQALGGVGETGMLGREGDASVFSFYATKIITGGQGGLVWSKNSSISTAIMDYRQFDCREEFRPRFNLQMTDIQAALINSQMSRLDAICNRRLFVSQSYVDVLPSGLTVQSGVTDVGRAAYRFIVMAPDLFSRDALRNHMEDAGVGCAIPVQRYELLHRYLKLDEADFPVAEDLANRTVSLPIHAGLTDSQIEHVASALSRFSP